MPLSRTIILSFACLLAAFSAQAKDYITGYTGYYNVLDNDDNASLFGLEYRGETIFYDLRPVGGFMVTSDRAVYGYAGLNYDFYLGDVVVITPNVVAGLYGDGDGKDLGGAIEFRSGIEAAYILPNESRVGVAFNHLSNASIYDKNPGTETVMVTYSYPLDGILGGN